MINLQLLWQRMIIMTIIIMTTMKKETTKSLDAHEHGVSVLNIVQDLNNKLALNLKCQDLT